jgi:hypothetical protein
MLDLGRFDGIACGKPFHRNVVVRIGEFGAGRLGPRSFVRVSIDAPSDLAGALELGFWKCRVVELVEKPLPEDVFTQVGCWHPLANLARHDAAFSAGYVAPGDNAHESPIVHAQVTVHAAVPGWRT